VADSGIIAEFLAAVGFDVDEKSLDSAMGKVKGFGLAVGAIAVGAAAAVLKVASEYDELGRASERLDVPVAKLQELQYAAEQTGSSADAVTRSLDGIRAANPRIKDTAAALELAGQNMRGMSRAAREAYAARMGIDPTLIPMLIKDTGALKDEFAKMYAVAGIDAQKAAEESRGFMIELSKLGKIATVLAEAISLSFMGKIRGDVERLRRGIVDNFDKIKKVIEGIISVAMRIVGAVSAMAGRIIGWVMRLVDWFDGLDKSQQRLVAGAAALLAAWRLLNLGFLATPLGAIVAGLAAVVALIDDYITYMEGGTAFFDWGPWEQTVTRVVAALRPLAGVLMGIVTALSAALIPAIDTVLDLLSGMATMVRHAIDLIYALFTGDFRGALDAGKALVNAYCDTVNQAFNGLVNTIAAYFAALWPSIAENFPDFALMAEAAASAIVEAFGSAFDFLARQMQRLTDWMPDWAKDKLGLGGGGGMSSAALIPAPAAAAAIAAPGGGSVALDQKTEINVYSSADPQAVGAAVAGRQDDVNARLLRNTVGATR
jgi:hypothetical protein